MYTCFDKSHPAQAEAIVQVKNEVQPIQEAEAARIKSEVAVFARRVADYQKGFRSRSFYKYSTGADQAYPEMDQAAKDYEDMAAELNKHTQLSNMFDCPETVAAATEGVTTIKGDLVMVKDVWDASSLVEQQFQVCAPSCPAWCAESISPKAMKARTPHQRLHMQHPQQLLLQVLH